MGESTSLDIITTLYQNVTIPRLARTTWIRSDFFYSTEEKFKAKGVRKMLRNSKAVIGIFVFFFTVILFKPLLAQVAGGGSIGGRVVDPSSAVLPGVSVTALATSTGVSRTVITNDQGRFLFPRLPTGSYQLTVELTGFNTSRLEGIELNVGEELDFAVQLEVGFETEVTVMADREAVNTTQAYAAAVGEEAIESLPLSGRRWEDLVLLTPGVVRSRGSISVGGLQTRGGNSYNIDGFDFNTSFFGMARGGNRPPFQTSQDAIQEFQIVTNSYAAEFGRVGGGVVNAVTKSGTNEFHGGAFFFIRDSAWGARNPFASTKPDDRRQQFGGSLGGPLKRDRVFFFFNTDNQRQNNPVILAAGDALNNAVGVTEADIAAAIDRYRGDPSFNSNITPQAGFQNFRQLHDFISGQLGLEDRRFDQVTLFQRVDWVINDRFNANFRYNFQNFDGNVFGGSVQNRALESLAEANVITHSAGAQLTTLLNSTTVMESRFQFARDDQPDNFLRDPASAIQGIRSEVSITDGTDYVFGPWRNLPRQIKENRFQIVNNLSILRGSHTFKTGFDINIIDQDNIQSRNAFGRYRFTNLVNFAIGAYQRFDQNLGPPATPQTLVEYAGFFQDDWKVTPNFTLNLGLRYDLQTFTQPTDPNPLVPETSRIPIDRNNFAPRLGWAWSFGSGSEFVLRGGYGITYVRTLSVDTEIFLYRNGQIRQIALFRGPDNVGGSDPLAPTAFNIFDATRKAPELGIPANTIQVSLADPNRVNGYVQQSNLTLERRLTPSLSASVGWLFLKGTKLTGKMHENVGSQPVGHRSVAVVDPSNRQIGSVSNVPDFNATRNRPNPELGDLFVNRSEYNSVYHGLAVSLNQRFAENYSFQLSYTLAKSIDDNPQQEGADVSSPFGQKGMNRGPSDQDQRHRLVFSGSFEQPRWEAGSPFVRGLFNGWKLGLILGYESGLPFSATTSGSLTRIRSGMQFAPAIDNGDYIPFGRSTFRQESFVQNDLRISRAFQFSEGLTLEFVAEAFNLVNRTNFGRPGRCSGQLGGGCSSLYIYSGNANYTDGQGNAARGEILRTNPRFGIPTSAFSPREIQFAIRLNF